MLGKLGILGIVAILALRDRLHHVLPSLRQLRAGV